MNIQHVSNSVGDYNGCKPKLFTDKLAGNIKACMGFEQLSKDSEFYIPNTILNEPTRDVVKQAYQLVAVFEKKREENLYGKLVYRAKKFNHEDLFKNTKIAPRLNTTNIEISFNK
jgi:hypothetical protein